MLNITIPGGHDYCIKHLVLDYNGTIACDGLIKAGVLEQLNQLAEELQVHVITADTHGSVHKACAGSDITVHVISKDKQDQQKQNYIKILGAQQTIAVGNGVNDELMLHQAALGIAVMQEEGVATKTLMASDLVFYSITDVLQSLIQSKRLIASLRNA